MNTGAKVTLAHANPDAGGVMASDALLAAAREAAMVAQRFADAVDQEARFPHEAFEVLREAPIQRNISKQSASNSEFIAPLPSSLDPAHNDLFDASLKRRGDILSLVVEQKLPADSPSKAWVADAKTNDFFKPAT